MQTKKIEYKDGTDQLEAFVAYDEKSQGKHPIVFIFHAWRGRDSFVEKKAIQLAELGYVGCALDMYGKEILGKNDEENNRLMGPFMADRALLRRRAQAGFALAASLPSGDTSRIGAMGFCFGGLCALDLARSGAPLKGVVSFHGLLNAPQKLPPSQIKAKILALHGHDDPMATPAQLLEFEKEMTQQKADWQVHVYGGTQHAFTNPEAHNHSMGLVHNPLAEKRAWISMKNFFAEVFS